MIKRSALLLLVLLSPALKAEYSHKITYSRAVARSTDTPTAAVKKELPEIEDVRSVIRSIGVDRMRYVPRKFQCVDYSWVLYHTYRSKMAELGFDTNSIWQLEVPGAGGRGHMINLVRIKSSEPRFSRYAIIEPQSSDPMIGSWVADSAAKKLSFPIFIKDRLQKRYRTAGLDFDKMFVRDGVHCARDFDSDNFSMNNYYGGFFDYPDMVEELKNSTGIEINNKGPWRLGH